jgi:hypothetical protein
MSVAAQGNSYGTVRDRRAVRIGSVAGGRRRFPDVQVMPARASAATGNPASAFALQLFLPVIATNGAGTPATCSLPHFGQAGLVAPCSEIVSIRSNVSLHCSQRYT